MSITIITIGKDYQCASCGRLAKLVDKVISDKFKDFSWNRKKLTAKNLDAITYLCLAKANVNLIPVCIAVDGDGNVIDMQGKIENDSCMGIYSTPGNEADEDKIFKFLEMVKNYETE